MGKKDNVEKKNKNKDVAGIETLEYSKYFDLIKMMPIILIIAMVPFILRMVLNPIDYPVNKLWPSEVDTDVYTYGKTIAIMIISLVMLVIMYLTFKKNTIRKDRISKVIYASAGALTLSLLISTSLSSYKDLAIWGAPERYEGLIIHICYMIIFMYTYLSVRKAEDFKYIKWAMIILSTGMAIIGLSQAMGKSVINMDFVRKMIVPATIYDSLEITDGGKTVYLTLMNSNYVGSYASMTILFFIAFAISKRENVNIRITSIIISLATMFILVKSGSQAGVVGVAVGILVIVTVNIKNIIKSPGIVIIILTMVLITASSVNFMTQGSFTSNIKRTVDDTVSLFTRTPDYLHDPSYGFIIKDIVLLQDNTEIETQFGIINMTFAENSKLEFNDKSGKDIISSYDTETNVYILKEPFNAISFAVSEESNESHVQSALIYEGIYYFIFEWHAGKGIQMIDYKTNIYDWESAPYIGFEGKENVGSARGYIWSRTLPLILEKPLFGYGPDNFIMNFPQYDMLAKIYVYKNVSMITDKPHSMYLLYAINSGLVGLTSVMILWGAYIFSSIKTILKTKSHSKVYYYSMGCLGAVSAYLATGIFNDSVPVIAPVFWVILGTGYALNYILRNEDVEVAKDEKQVI